MEYLYITLFLPMMSFMRKLKSDQEGTSLTEDITLIFLRSSGPLPKHLWEPQKRAA